MQKLRVAQVARKIYKLQAESTSCAGFAARTRHLIRESIFAGGQYLGIIVVLQSLGAVAMVRLVIADPTQPQAQPVQTQWLWSQPLEPSSTNALLRLVAASDR